MNLPNKITVTRIGLAVVLFVLLETWCANREGLPWFVAFVLFVTTVATDGLDGYFARARNQITAFGRIADPLADKIVINGVLVITMQLPQTEAYVPAWLVILSLSREFLVSGLRGFLEGRGEIFAARWEGKTKLVVQAIFCGAVILYPGAKWDWVHDLLGVLLWVTAAVTVWSAVSYVRRAAEVLREASDV